MRNKLLLNITAVLLCAATFHAGAERLRFASQGDITSMDPYAIDETFTTGFLGNVYEGLIRRAPDLSIEPALAESWEMVEPLRWRFHLRQGVKFHDGSPFTADDVLYSAERVRSGASDFKNRLAPDTRVIKVDDYTVDFVTTTPNPTLHYQWGNWYMMSKSWAAKNNIGAPDKSGGGEENHATRHENGTGPFRLDSREPGIRATLKANPDWWGNASRPGNITEVVFTPIPNASTRVAALLSGQLDVIFPVPVQDIERVERTAGTHMLVGPELRTIYLFLDQFRDELLYSNVKGKNPLKDRRVREALYRAIDIETINKKVMRGMSTPSALMIAPGINGFSPDFKRLDYDATQARELLAQAGYPDGFELGLDCPNDRYVNDEAICVAVANMWSKVGVKVKLNAQTKTKFFEKVFAPKLDFSVGLIGSTPPSFDSWAPINSLHMCPRVSPDAAAWGEEQREKVSNGKSNYGGYCNPEVDKLANQILSETDRAERNALIKAAWRITTDDIAYIPLHQQWIAWGVRDGIELKQRPDDIFDWRYVRVNR
ncbi:ABC transporter substrate-binding protein [Brenneria tiliae]|uniref:ABC transporter substrate-binding protein n=1 Tax=Brenneria tiliae TaxID=2914984 RepID=UPI002014E240|nr:ABC transporter substrate-binding protein [Brenneria tiliae]MCL2896921.1 ABC transporter substrate-binding protein [Brenneria tiliae]MCL2901479.1 ABC transporter substrate-binding protein [Brenneria tiliae]